MPSKLEITQAPPRNGVRVIALKGQLDAHTLKALQRELEQLGETATPRGVLDCAGLDYISSAGLAVLTKHVTLYRRKNGDLRLACLSDKVANVVNLLGLQLVIKVFKGLDEAVGSFA